MNENEIKKVWRAYCDGKTGFEELIETTDRTQVKCTINELERCIKYIKNELKKQK